MNFDNIALFARDLDAREDGTKYGTEKIENRRKTWTSRNSGRTKDKTFSQFNA